MKNTVFAMAAFVLFACTEQAKESKSTASFEEAFTSNAVASYYVKEEGAGLYKSAVNVSDAEYNWQMPVAEADKLMRARIEGQEKTVGAQVAALVMLDKFIPANSDGALAAYYAQVLVNAGCPDVQPLAKHYAALKAYLPQDKAAALAAHIQQHASGIIAENQSEAVVLEAKEALNALQ
jgi:hypothetical protein